MPANSQRLAKYVEWYAGNMSNNVNHFFVNNKLYFVFPDSPDNLHKPESFKFDEVAGAGKASQAPAIITSINAEGKISPKQILFKDENKCMRLIVNPPLLKDKKGLILFRNNDLKKEFFGKLSF